MAGRVTTHNRYLLLILLSVGMQATVQGFMTERTSPSDSLVFSIMAFATTAGIFGVVHRVRSGRTTPAPRETRVAMAWMNLATAITFLSYYLSISIIPASTTSSIEAALGPAVLILIALVVFRRREWKGRVDLWSISIMMAFGLLLAGRTWQLSDRSTGSAAAMIGLVLAVAAGSGMAVVVLLSKSFGKTNTSPVWVTAHRFHLTYVLAALAWLVSEPQVPDASELVTLFVFGVFAVVIPLFLLQVGFQRADSLPAITLVALLPAMTWLAQLAAGQSADAISLLLIVGVVSASVTFTTRQASKRVENPT